MCIRDRHEGMYSVVITVDDCTVETVDFFVDVFAPPVVVPQANHTVAPDCSPQDLFLTSGATGTGLLSYEWTGPNGFTGTTPDPTIPSAQPVNNGTYTVVVTDANGCSTQEQVEITTIQETLADPDIESSGPACEGDQITVFVSDFIGTDVTYTWTTPNGVVTDISGLGTSSITINNANDMLHEGMYSVFVTVDGCEVESIDFFVEVYTPPVVVPQASHMVAPDCSPQDLLLISGATGSGLLSYEWTGPDGFASTLANPTLPNAQAANNGAYTVVVTDTNGCTTQQQVEVTSIRDIVVDPDISSSGPACEGEQISLNVDDYEGVDVIYTWSTPNGVTNISGLGTSEITINNANTALHEGMYAVTVTVDDCTVESIDFFVDVFDRPMSSITPVQGVVCTDGTGSIQLDGIPSAGSPGYTYAWTGPNGFASTLEDPMLTNITSAMSGTYTFQVTDANGCQSTVESVEVSINDGIDEPTFLYSGQACDQGVATLSVPQYAGSNVTYTWTTPAGVTANIAGLNTNEITIDPISAIHEGMYSVMVTVDGCSATTDAFPIALAEPVTLAPSFNTAAVCHGGDVGLFSNAIGNGVLDYQWSGPAGFSSDLPNPTINDVSVINNGTYTVTVTNGNGCEAFAEVTVNNILINTAVPTIAASDPICEGEDLILTTSSNCVNYRWIGPDGASPETLMNPLLTTSVGSTVIPQGDDAYDAGMWSVICVDANGCESEMSTAVEFTINTVPQAIATNSLSLIHI